MLKTIKTLGLAAVLSCAATAGALAADGFATANVNLRAGPGTDYPRVATLNPGTPLEVYGCLNGWGWCDVNWNGYRGWVAGSYVQMIDRGRRVALPSYAPRASIPVITFQIGDYWDRNYKRQAWYRDRDRYDHRRWDRRDDRRDHRRDDRRDGRRDDRRDWHDERRGDGWR